MAGRRAAARLQRTVNFLKGPRNPPEHLLSNAQPQRVRKSLDPVAFNDTIPGLYPPGLGLIGADPGISPADFQENDRRNTDFLHHRLGQLRPTLGYYKSFEPSIAQLDLSA